MQKRITLKFSLSFCMGLRQTTKMIKKSKLLLAWKSLTYIRLLRSFLASKQIRWCFDFRCPMQKRITMKFPVPFCIGLRQTTKNDKKIKNATCMEEFDLYQVVVIISC